MANPFTVQPLGGLQGMQQIYEGMGNVAETYQANQQQERQQQLMQQAQEVFDRGNPREIAQFSLQNPEIGQALQGATKFASDATRQNLKSSMQEIIAGRNPAEVIQRRAEMVRAQGGDPSDTLRDLQMAQEDPEGYRQMISNMYALQYGEEGVPGMGGDGGPSIGTYNPRDYTTESFAEFTRTGDPAVLERYAAQRTVDIGGVPHVFDPARGGYYPASVSRDGAGGEAEQRPVTATDVAESEAEITSAREGAKQEVKARSPAEQRELDKQIKERQTELSRAEDVISRVDTIANNPDFISSISGFRGVMPAIPGTGGYDAEIAFDQLKNTLTLGNLGQMSGVLSESDIKILSSAAGGLEYGMSEEALKNRLSEIRGVFESKTAEEREKLRKLMNQRQRGQSGQGMAEEDADAFINSILGQGQ